MQKKTLLFALLGGLFIQSHAQAATLEQIKEQDFIRIGVAATKPPFGFVGGEDGDSIGFEVELARAMAQDLLGDPDKIDFVLLESKDRIPALENDEVDVILANFTATPARAEVVDFAKPYLRTQLGILAPENAPIESLDALKGKTLIVPEKTIAEEYFATHYPEVTLKTYEDNASSFINFRRGEGDALSQDNTLLFPWADSNAGFVVSIGGFGEEFFIAPAVQKGNQALLDFVNQKIDAMRKDGRMVAAYEKYLQPVFKDTLPKEKVLVLE